MCVEIELNLLDQPAEVLEVEVADVVLLDDMDDATLCEAARMMGGLPRADASGNMRLDRIATVAATGVECVSVGR